MSMKNSDGTIGNRTRDLPACSAVPQPTAPLRASLRPNKSINYYHIIRLLDSRLIKILRTKLANSLLEVYIKYFKY